MSYAETVAHLHRAMTWDFRLMAIINALLLAVVVLVLLGRKS